MGTYVDFQVPKTESEDASLWLDNHPLNVAFGENECIGKLHLYSNRTLELDLAWCDTDACNDPEYFREYFVKEAERRIGKCNWKIDSSEMDESDWERLTDLLCEFNGHFNVAYDSSLFGESECGWYFNKEQQMRISENGLRLYFGIDGIDAKYKRIANEVSAFLSGKTWEERYGIEPVPSESKEKALSIHVDFARNNDNFYPTPKSLAVRMLSKIDYKRKINTVLEPSAGKGDLIEAMKNYSDAYYNENGRRYESEPFRNKRFLAIEKDRELVANLMGKRIEVIDTDFLAFNGLEQVDLIVMNPPFDDGDKHLHKALDIMFSGQIVCLLNAKTIKNPYTNERKRLVQRLKDLKADIEYIENAFADIDSQRKTDVEVAMVYININADAENDLFSKMREEAEIEVDEISDHNEVASFNEITNLVLRYNRERKLVNDQIMAFYVNHKFVGKYLKLGIRNAGVDDETHAAKDETLTETMKRKLNEFNAVIKAQYWKKAIDLEPIQSRLTSASQNTIYSMLENFTKLEFNESNIRQFIINVIEAYPRMIQGAIEWLFEEMTKYAIKDRNRWAVEECKTNIHYFNAWKTNNGYRVNKKVIIPSFYINWDFGTRLSWDQEKLLSDMHKIMSYFDGEICSGDTAWLVNKALGTGDTRKIDTKFFYISVFKKGTIHFEFKDLDILRRFNIAACQGKNWLPMDYAEKPWQSMSEEEKEVARSFEENGEKGYTPIYDGILRIGQAPLTNLLPSAPSVEPANEPEATPVVVTENEENVCVVDQSFEEETDADVLLAEEVVVEEAVIAVEPEKSNNSEEIALGGLFAA
jgi:hypothetical protein